MDSLDNDPHTLCVKCNNYVRTPNFLIHEARCKGPTSLNQSRVTSQILNNSRAFNNKPKPTTIQNLPRIQEQERIPCHFCGYPQTLMELDSHPKQCQHREQQCEGCRQMFPRSLMDQHMMFCPARRSNQQQNRPQFEEYHQQPQFDLPRRPQQNYPRRQMINPTDIFSIFMDQMNRVNGGMGNMNMNMNMNRYQMGGQREQPTRTRVMRVVSFGDFMNLVQHLAGRHGRMEQQGLNEQQISQFPVSKFKPSPEKKNIEGDQLCIICYCNFEAGEDCMTLPCKHIFHPECVGTWLKKNPTCPVCKHNFGNQRGSHHH